MSATAPDILDAAVALSGETGRSVADVGLDEIARRVGISRATLFRRIGSRRALDDALRAAGVDPGGRPGVRERAVDAAAAIVRSRGIVALTLEAVAAEADCSVPALHSQLGGREGLLAALFERFSPLPAVERIVADAPPLADGVRAVYAATFDAAQAEPRLVQALLADALARPDGPAGRFLTQTYLPRAVAAVGGWLAAEVAAGRARPLPPPLLLQLLVAPMAFHATTRPLFEAMTGLAAPDREEVIDILTEAFCRAVALSPYVGGDAPGGNEAPAED